MSTEVRFAKESWNHAVYQWDCICGHKLYQHAFLITSAPIDPDYVLWTSQCTICKYDHETKKFDCEGFVQKE